MIASLGKQVSDLLCYLVLETSYYTNEQFKAFKSLEAYNQMVSGFVTSVQGKEIADKIVVVAKVRHSQRMNDPLVNIWIIAEKDGSIISAHCQGCKAGLAESCSHLARVMFYIEAVTRIQGKLACIQSEMRMEFTNICQRSTICKGWRHRLFISKETQRRAGTENRDIESKYWGRKQNLRTV